MFHFISSYDLVETEVYHQKFSFTRKWEDCGDCLTCEELSGGYSYKDNKTNQEVLLPCSLEYYVM